MPILRYKFKIKVMSYLNVNKKYSSFNSELAKSEKNDCFVRALATAAETAYDIAHEFAKEVFSRKDKSGTPTLDIDICMRVAEESSFIIDGKEVNVKVLGKSDIKNRYKVKGDIIWRKKTLKSFVQTHKKGTYLVTVANHALTVKDGEVLDWDSNTYLPTRKVQSAYEITIPKEEDKQLSLWPKDVISKSLMNSLADSSSFQKNYDEYGFSKVEMSKCVG